MSMFGSSDSSSSDASANVASDNVSVLLYEMGENGRIRSNSVDMPLAATTNYIVHTFYH